MVLRRLWTKDLGPREKIQDSEHLASEIHDEILRLEELRNRLDPSYAMLGHDISASPVASKLRSSSADGEFGASEEGEPVVDGEAKKDGEAQEGEAAAAAAPSQDVIDAAVAEATKHLNDEIASLNAKLNEAPSGDTSPTGEAVAEAAAANDEEMKKLSAKVEELNEKLEDYRAFEDEIALVKSYKEEIEKLKGQIVEMEGSQPAITDDDITSLFQQMGNDDAGEEDSSQEESVDDMLADAFGDSAPVETASGEAASEDAEEKKIEGDAASDDEKQVFEGDAAAEEDASIFAAEEKTEEKPEEKEGGAAEDDFSLETVNEGNAEAIAELGEEGDELMAEFEKALSPEKEEST